MFEDQHKRRKLDHDQNPSVESIHSRIGVLEGTQVAFERRLELLEKTMGEIAVKLDAYDDLHERHVRTLEEINTTLRAMSEMMSAYTKVKNTFGVLKGFGDFVRWLFLIGGAFGGVWLVFKMIVATAAK